MTLPELMIGLSVAGIAVAFSFGQYFQYQESITASRAIREISSDVTVTRGLAMRMRAPVSLVANEAQLSYEIRDTLGTVYQRRDFSNGQEIELTGLDVMTAGDSLTFDGRGVIVSGGTLQVSATRRDKSRTIRFNALGRRQIN